MGEASSRLMRDQRREMIKKAALTKMLEFGVESVSIRSIAREAKISETLFYRFYKNKYAILYDLLLSEFKEISVKVDELIATIKVSVTELAVALPVLSNFLKKILSEHQHLLSLIIREEEKINQYLNKGKMKLKKQEYESLQKLLQQFLNPESLKILTEYFQRCKADGNLREDLDPEICSMMVITVIWQTVLKNPYKFLHPKIDEKYFEYLLDSQLKLLIHAMEP